MHSEIDRISLPILDDDASVTFYLAYKKQNKQKLNKLSRLIK